MNLNLLSFKGRLPELGDGVFLAPTSVLIGDVVVGEDTSFWFQVTARGDVNHIRIGSRSNIQDSSTLHVTTERFPLIIGNGVTLGHGVIAHGCEIGDNCLIGIGSRILDGAVIEEGSIVGAGAVVTPGTRIPSGCLALGIPAKSVRELTGEEVDLIHHTSEHYVRLKNIYINNNNNI
jgi:carbonic anhydrase/acetyltransferase-like protein (isoleucine patch superfamily)